MTTTKVWDVTTMIQAAPGCSTEPGPTLQIEAETADDAATRARHDVRKARTAAGEPTANVGAYAVRRRTSAPSSSRVWK